MPSLPLLPLLLPPLTSLSKWQFILLCFQQSQWSQLCSLTTERLADNDLAYSQRIRSDLWFSHGIYTWTHKSWVSQKGMCMHTAESHKHMYMMCISTLHVHVHALVIDWLVDLHLLAVVWLQLMVVFTLIYLKCFYVIYKLVISANNEMCKAVKKQKTKKTT